MTAPKILIIEDEFVVQDILKRLLKSTGYALTFLDRGDSALRQLENNHEFDLVISDLMLPGANGMAILEKSKSIAPDVPVIIITAFASVDSALEAMKGGAFDYVTKPFNNDEALLTIQKALERRRLLQENKLLRQELDFKYGFENIVGRSNPMKEVFSLIQQAAPSTATILIRGESGTGKELIARAIHHNSSRKDKPFVTLNAGAIPSDLLESQLFGHLKGAFTSASSDKKGLFKVADTGSFFLDEIGNINLDTQAKLLRVLQEREFMPVGSTQTVRVDVRLICATNADLEQMIQEGSFREDLYYRMNVIEIQLPPLRDRKDDLPLLVDFFLRKFQKENNKEIENVGNDFLVGLENYHWPGNVRELENVIERAVILCQNGVIGEELLPPSVRKRLAEPKFPSLELMDHLNLPLQMQAIEKTLIKRAIDKAGGVQKKAAEILGVKTSTLSEMLKRHKLR